MEKLSECHNQVLLAKHAGSGQCLSSETTFSFSNCHYFISQNIKILIILYRWCSKHFFPTYFLIFLAKIYISSSLYFIFPSQHIWDFQIQAQLLFPLKSEVQFENWLWGVSYYSPKHHNLRSSLLGSERNDCVVQKHTHTNPFLRENKWVAFIFLHISIWFLWGGFIW